MIDANAGHRSTFHHKAFAVTPNSFILLSAIRLSS